MRVLIVRHGEPDYAHDCLTENGRHEAELLGERIAKLGVDDFYVSPMGRARETCEYTVKRLGVEAEVCDWLHEFDVRVNGMEIWDLSPEKWTKERRFFSEDTFLGASPLDTEEMRVRTAAVREGLDGILARYGYIREGGAYRSGRNDKTIALYCHFGAGCMVIAHLLGISPLLTLQGFSCEPTAIAMLCTDERHDGLVNFRLHGYGDISHLGKSLESGGVCYQ
ncbi:probable phosphoglycerate mutase [Ruminococcus sp. YE71]|uniref:histidine phosphatase family protein n=1 Tax=unclassified Ruminococcus TaxID=2608920 RepID=UPI0008890749|nr:MULTISPECIES: histidine phosphatase family protein [unclassified Ruminococcus]SDA23679.1 probable phosphoglycerate mutase [Ruminococcus sp. YE78]SFW40260.1 probable phosphoglycerate mutase [Ruminococcus sp. YE71]